MSRVETEPDKLKDYSQVDQTQSSVDEVSVQWLLVHLESQHLPLSPSLCFSLTLTHPPPIHWTA